MDKRKPFTNVEQTICKDGSRCMEQSMKKHQWCIERTNSLAKDGDSRKKSLFCAMQSLYEEDNIFVQQYIAADGGSKITYRSEASEEQ